MKVELLLVGKTVNSVFVTAIADYTKRIGHYIPFNISVIPELKYTKNISAGQQKDAEGELILKKLQADDHLVLLDEHGKEMLTLLRVQKRNNII